MDSIIQFVSTATATISTIMTNISDARLSDEEFAKKYAREIQYAQQNIVHIGSARLPNNQ